nr:glutamine synthetase family protein [Conexibacter arvalis]
MVVAPDWSTARRLPGREHVVAVLCDGLRKDGTPHPAHPRSALRRVERDCAEAGFESCFGVEFEFWAFRLDERADAALASGDVAGLTPLSRLPQGYSLLRWPDCGDFVDDLTATMSAYGVPIETVLTEIGDGMLEAALAPGTALEAADRAARFKLGAREVAARHGLLLSFIAKLRPSDQGSSGHLHQSLLRDGRNAFWDGAPERLSETGRHYLAGLLHATHECGAMMAPFPNSYRRFDPAQWAPCEAAWGFDNRNACVRAITTGAGGTRFEQRRPGADLQPYLAIAACLAGGLHGIRERLEPPPEADKLGRGEEARTLDRELVDAAATLRASRFARETFGDELVELYAATREAEAEAWTRLRDGQIPPWEIKRYLEVV